jgi:hypothetical protein
MDPASLGPSQLRSGISGRQAALVVARFRSPRASQLAQHIEQFCWFEFGNRTPPNRWEDICLQTPEDLARVVGRPSAFPVFVPFACDRFESIASGNLGGAFTLTFHYGRIDVGS